MYEQRSRSIMSPFRLLACLTVCVVLVPPTTAAYAQSEPYRPFNVGNWWQYVSSSSEYETQHVDRSDTIQGNPVCVVRYEGSGDEGLENFWTSEGNGSILLWGFYREIEGFGFYYDPPLEYLDAPLTLGKTWACTTDVYNFYDATYRETLVLSFSVLEEGTVAVPAGDFFSYGIGYTFGAIASSDSGSPGIRFRSGRILVNDNAMNMEYDLRGERILMTAEQQDTSYTHLTWFSMGIGEVKFEYWSLYAIALTDTDIPETRSGAALYQNYPNPFNPSTVIRYYVPERCDVAINVYDARGVIVRCLLDGVRAKGTYAIQWDGCNMNGIQASSGIYFCNLEAGRESISRKIILIR